MVVDGNPQLPAGYAGRKIRQGIFIRPDSVSSCAIKPPFNKCICRNFGDVGFRPQQLAGDNAVVVAPTESACKHRTLLQPTNSIPKRSFIPKKALPALLRAFVWVFWSPYSKTTKGSCTAEVAFNDRNRRSNDRYACFRILDIPACQ